MLEVSKLDQETRDYFETLPGFIKESIMQSGVQINGKEDLERCAKSMMESE